MGNKVIILDPGHGGKDPGALENGYIEKELTLKISKYMIQRFNELGFLVAMTRDSDTTLEPSPRAAAIRNYGARCCISNHINAGGGVGAELWTSIHSDKKWANIMASELAKTGLNPHGQWVKSRAGNKSKNTDYYFIHRDTGNVECIIIEWCFIDNLDDINRFIANYQTYAEAVIKATCEYYGISYKKPAGDPLDDALEIMQKAGINLDQGYWSQNAMAGKTVKGEYAAALIQKFAQKLGG